MTLIATRTELGVIGSLTLSLTSDSDSAKQAEMFEPGHPTQACYSTREQGELEGARSRD
jgi:hypothetical protein